MKKLTFVIVMLALIMNLSGQNPYREITFTAIDNGLFLPIRKETPYWPTPHLPFTKAILT